MNKMISGAFAILFLFLFLFTAFAKESEGLQLFVESTTVSANDMFDVKIKIKNNPGIVSANINISFDDKLILIGAKNGTAFPSSMSFIPPRQLSTIGEIKNNCNFAWQGTDVSDKDIKDGTILILTFDAATATVGDDICKITVSARKSDIIDKNLNAVEVEPHTGNVKIICDLNNVECNCLCHKSGISKRIYNIIRIMWKIFSVNRGCSCGIAHY